MAHRLPPAGISTPLSEHYVNYFVIPKPTQYSVSCEAQSSSCCIRPKFLCLSQSSVQSSCKCVDLSQPPCQPSPLSVECAFKGSYHQLKKRCVSKPCPRCVCCCARKEIARPTCCCSTPDCCCKEDHTCAISITLPRSDDQVMEQKMKKKLKRLKTDVEKFDEALACLENRNSKTVQGGTEPCKPRCCCCCCAKPIPPRDLCCVPRICGGKPVCLHCRPFYGKKKSIFQKFVKLT